MFQTFEDLLGELKDKYTSVCRENERLLERLRKYNKDEEIASRNDLIQRLQRNALLIMSDKEAEDRLNNNNLREVGKRAFQNLNIKEFKMASNVRIKIGLKCSECGDINYTTTKNSKKTTDKIGHDMVSDAYVAPTCTEPGLTEGSHCSRCEHKVAQETIDPLGHDFSVKVPGTDNYTDIVDSIVKEDYQIGGSEVYSYTPEKILRTAKKLTADIVQSDTMTRKEKVITLNTDVFEDSIFGIERKLVLTSETATDLINMTEKQK